MHRGMGSGSIAGGVTSVLLLKTRSSPTDAYEDYFKGLEGSIFKPQFVPVLQHQFFTHALSCIRSSIAEGSFKSDTSNAGGDGDRFGGIIFTSQRAVDAFGEIISVLRATGLSLEKLIPPDVVLFVVGPATANGVRALQLGCPVLGEETGNGEALADYILANYGAGENLQTARRPLLFLVGEQRRDIIPKKLQDGALALEQRIEVVEKTVYGTAEMASFPDDFQNVLDQPDVRQGDSWAVVFSPTGCRAMLRTLGWLDGEERFDIELAKQRNSRVRVATIGPTTRDFLTRSFDFEPHVCADTPTPDGVASGIIKYMSVA